jgi:polyhydroxybutyrate depolymerase
MATVERQHKTADAAALQHGDQHAEGDSLQEFRLTSSSSHKDNSRFLSEAARGNEREKIAELFGHFDINHDGFIDKNEIAKADKAPHKVEGADPQLFSNFLSERYKSLMQSSNDEWFFENNGVSLKDINKYVENMHAFSDKITDARGDTTYKLNLQGRERDVTVHVPPNYDATKPMPMVVMMHGFMQDKDKIAQTSEFKKKADQEGFIAVFPNATGWLGDHLRWWNVGNDHLYRSDDVDFIRQLTDVIPDKLNVDQNRIYLVGFSNGDMMAQEAAAKLNDRVAAVASVSGGMLRKQDKPTGDMNALLIHGSSDDVIPASGGVLLDLCVAPRVISAVKAFEVWADANDLKPTLTKSSGEPIQTYSAVDTESGREVTFYNIKDGNHDWPGAFNSSTPASKFNATDAVWNFLNRHNKKELIARVRDTREA